MMNSADKIVIKLAVRCFFLGAAAGLAAYGILSLLPQWLPLTIGTIINAVVLAEMALDCLRRPKE